MPTHEDILQFIKTKQSEKTGKVYPTHVLFTEITNHFGAFDIKLLNILVKNGNIKWGCCVNGVKWFSC